MKEYLIKLKEWWNNLGTRERRLFSIGGVIVVILIIYAGIWQPYNNYVANMRSSIGQSEKLLQWMKMTDQLIQKHEQPSLKKTGISSPVAMLGVLQKYIEKNGLGSALKQLKQASNDSIEMHFEKASFDKLIQMLITITKENNLLVSQFTVTSLSDDGVVNADVILKL